MYEPRNVWLWKDGVGKPIEIRGLKFHRVFQDDHYFHFGDKRIMNISVIHEDETENEIELELCCAMCSSAYGWSSAQFDKIWAAASKSLPIKIPSSVDSVEKFKQFVKTL